MLLPFVRHGITIVIVIELVLVIIIIIFFFFIDRPVIDDIGFDFVPHFLEGEGVFIFDRIGEG